MEGIRFCLGVGVCFVFCFCESFCALAPVRFEPADAQYESSVAQTAHLSASLLPDGLSFDLLQHTAQVKEVRKARTKEAEETHRNELSHLTSDHSDLLSTMQKRCASKSGTGHWLAAFATAADDFVLSNEEFRTALCIRYAIAPPQTSRQM